jgi:uncharacterized membrane protein (UPF0127 family)
MRVYNTTRNTSIATQCTEARSFLARLRGLMGHPGLEAGQGLLIEPCSSVHSFFMRFPIDVIFVDRANTVVLPAGTIAASGTQIGDALQVER